MEKRLDRPVDIFPDIREDGSDDLLEQVLMESRKEMLSLVSEDELSRKMDQVKKDFKAFNGRELNNDDAFLGAFAQAKSHKNGNGNGKLKK